MQKAKQALLFVNKKKQKNFGSLKHLTPVVALPKGIRSFLLLFFKKEVLSYTSKQPFMAVRGQ
jgi:hypothetical protein